MATVQDLAVRFNQSRAEIELELRGLAHDWHRRGIKVPVIDEHGEVDPDAIMELSEILEPADEGPESQIDRFKWVADGETTLAGVAEKLRAYATYLDGLIEQGWELTHEVDEGYLHMERKE
jgi:hypothetical protein